MEIYNIDECGVSIVHKGGKVITITIISCVSAAGFALPPFIIYPRKRINENLKGCAYSGTSFHCNDSGWITQELYVKWFQFFSKQHSTQTASSSD